LICKVTFDGNITSNTFNVEAYPMTEVNNNYSVNTPDYKAIFSGSIGNIVEWVD
jgi:hypothetical protein